MLRSTLQGIALGALASTTLIFAGVTGGAFEAHPRPVINMTPSADIAPPAPVRVNFPFAYKGQAPPAWCAEGMPCWEGSAADGRHWRRLTSSLADALAEGAHPEMVPPTKVIRRGGCWFAPSTDDISCMTGWMTNIKEGRWIF